MSNAPELLRRLLTGWYRDGQPWKAEPTLAAFKSCQAGKVEKPVQVLIDDLIARHGPDMEIHHLRLCHLIELV
jgi:hypothetical protein